MTSLCPLLPIRLANSSLYHGDCKMVRMLREIVFDKCSACVTMMILSNASCASNQAERHTDAGQLVRISRRQVYDQTSCVLLREKIEFTRQIFEIGLGPELGIFELATWPYLRKTKNSDAIVLVGRNWFSFSLRLVFIHTSLRERPQSFFLPGPEQTGLKRGRPCAD